MALHVSRRGEKHDTEREQGAHALLPYATPLGVPVHSRRADGLAYDLPLCVWILLHSQLLSN
jgi:hypothetical protein